VRGEDRPTRVLSTRLWTSLWKLPTGVHRGDWALTSSHNRPRQWPSSGNLSPSPGVAISCRVSSRGRSSLLAPIELRLSPECQASTVPMRGSRTGWPGNRTRFYVSTFAGRTDLAYRIRRGRGSAPDVLAPQHAS
jgi:hypothetical protein